MEINRGLIKTRAKQVLFKNFFMSLVMSVAVYVVAMVMVQVAMVIAATMGVGWTASQFSSQYDQQVMVDYANSVDLANMAEVGIAAVMFVLLFCTLFAVFVCAPLEVGVRRYFVGTARGEKLGIACLWSGFKTLSDIVAAMLMRAVLTFLWSLLFVVPGIIKAYSYSMVPYILADNPHLEWERVLKLSEEMMRGRRWKLFVLQLSFIGWQIAGSLIFGIGQVLVLPYMDATVAQWYLALRENAIVNNITTEEELQIGFQQTADASSFEK